MPRYAKLTRMDTDQEYSAPLAAGEAVMNAIAAVPDGNAIIVEVSELTEVEFLELDAVARPWD